MIRPSTHQRVRKVSTLSSGVLWSAATAGLLVLCSGIFAQDSFPAPDERLVNAAAEMEATQQVSQEVVSPEPIPPEPITTAPGPEVSLNGRPVAETPRRLQYGISLTLRGVHDDNINISSFNRVSDYFLAIEPSLFIGLGSDEPDAVNFLRLIYRPSAFLFANNTQDNAIQHVVRLTASHQFSRLSLSLTQDVQILDGVDLNSISDPTGHTANIDLQQRTRHNIFATGVSGSYDLTGKLSVSSAFGLGIEDYPSGVGIGSKNFYGNLFINYAYSQKLVIGLGGTGGFNTVEQFSPDQTYEQANLRATYNATAKVNFSGSVGLEFRQFQGDTRGTYVTPVYDLTATYQPFDGTSISLSGTRRTENSAALGGQDYSSTAVDLLVSQRFMQRFALSLAMGYINSDYFSTIAGITASRQDNYYYIEPAVDCSITRFWTAGAYYLYRESFSSLDFFSFYDNQIGLRTKLTF